MKLAQIFIFVICFLSHFHLSESVNVECSYHFNFYAYIRKIYKCTVQNDPHIISKEAAVISSASGTHESGKNKNDVSGFRAYIKTIHYFPKGLENIFVNLKAICIWKCGLKEIHASDLEPFPKLEYLSFYRNDIKILEKGLFEFNPLLGLIDLRSNKIFHIDANVFENLNKLVYLELDKNKCTLGDALNSTSEVQKLIEEAKSCHSEEVIGRELTELENNFKLENLTEFMKLFSSVMDKFEQVENSVMKKMENVEQYMNDKISTQDQSINSSNKNLEGFKEQIEQVEKSMAKKMESVKQSISDKFSAQEQSVNDKFSVQEQSIHSIKKNIESLENNSIMYKRWIAALMAFCTFYGSFLIFMTYKMFL